MSDCPEFMGLVLLALALLISLCFNVIFCIRRKTTLCRDKDECCFTHIYTGESPSQDEGHYFHNLSHNEQQENPRDRHEEQENPIYGNISSDRRDSVEACYEMMTMHHTRDRMKCLESDLNYASLDLKTAKKRMKKNRHQQGHGQGRNELQDELPGYLTTPPNAFLEVEVDMDAHLPSRDTSAMVSHSSIYLNSQQIAQETEEMERERGINMERENMGWEGIRRREDGQSREWKEEQASEGREVRQNGSVCTQLPETEAIQTGPDHLIRTFSFDIGQQD
ncbi:uncharacterized protein LOC121952688 [Plectropomus leopardus]|uniref:uncharacterized protein LOC121952688 n=1 Tax=Plectropomus leopardus TaxID=160734 RepID=UPI001C4AA732|nr:uncharacterized protein LOC121952688 [Plectropomus leopardus]